jgi:3-deoxy-D-manno-octulosonic-acid transferase
VVTGNLKQGGPEILDGTTTGTSEKAVRAASGRPLLVAGSTHHGEEVILLEVFSALKKRLPGLQLALAPRHPERFSDVEKLLQQLPVSFAKKSRMDNEMVFDADVLLVDTLGDLAKLYALADVAFVGGSLVDVGGHNLLEPARLKKPLVFGPFMENFRTLADAMITSGGAIEARGAGDLLAAIELLLNDPVKRRSAGENACQVAMADSAVVERSLALVARYVEFKTQRELSCAARGTVAGL